MTTRAIVKTHALDMPSATVQRAQGLFQQAIASARSVTGDPSYDGDHTDPKLLAKHRPKGLRGPERSFWDAAFRETLYQLDVARLERELFGDDHDAQGR